MELNSFNFKAQLVRDIEAITSDAAEQGRSSRMSKIVKQLLRVHGDEYNSFTSRQMAIAIKRYINKEIHRKNPNFINEIYRKLLCLHEYNLEVAKVKYKYPKSKQLDDLLVRYMELECALLIRAADNDGSIDAKQEKAAQDRILRILQVIVFDSMNTSENSNIATKEHCFKLMMTLCLSVDMEYLQSVDLIMDIVSHIVRKAESLMDPSRNLIFKFDSWLKDVTALPGKKHFPRTDYHSESESSEDSCSEDDEDAKFDFSRLVLYRHGNEINQFITSSNSNNRLKKEPNELSQIGEDWQISKSNSNDDSNSVKSVAIRNTLNHHNYPPDFISKMMESNNKSAVDYFNIGSKDGNNSEQQQQPRFESSQNCHNSFNSNQVQTNVINNGFQSYNKNFCCGNNQLNYNKKNPLLDSTTGNNLRERSNIEPIIVFDDESIPSTLYASEEIKIEKEHSDESSENGFDPQSMGGGNNNNDKEHSFVDSTQTEPAADDDNERLLNNTTGNGKITQSSEHITGEIVAENSITSTITETSAITASIDKVTIIEKTSVGAHQSELSFEEQPIISTHVEEGITSNFNVENLENHINPQQSEIIISAEPSEMVQNVGELVSTSGNEYLKIDRNSEESVVCVNSETQEPVQSVKMTELSQNAEKTDSIPNTESLTNPINIEDPTILVNVNAFEFTQLADEANSISNIENSGDGTKTTEFALGASVEMPESAQDTVITHPICNGDSSEDATITDEFEMVVSAETPESFKSVDKTDCIRDTENLENCITVENTELFIGTEVLESPLSADKLRAKESEIIIDSDKTELIIENLETGTKFVELDISTSNKAPQVAVNNNLIVSEKPSADSTNGDELLTSSEIYSKPDSSEEISDNIPILFQSKEEIQTAASKQTEDINEEQPLINFISCNDAEKISTTEQTNEKSLELASIDEEKNDSEITATNLDENQQVLDIESACKIYQPVENCAEICELAAAERTENLNIEPEETEIATTSTSIFLHTSVSSPDILINEVMSQSIEIDTNENLEVVSNEHISATKIQLEPIEISAQNSFNANTITNPPEKSENETEQISETEILASDKILIPTNVESKEQKSESIVEPEIAEKNSSTEIVPEKTGANTSIESLKEEEYNLGVLANAAAKVADSLPVDANESDSVKISPVVQKRKRRTKARKTLTRKRKIKKKPPVQQEINKRLTRSGNKATEVNLLNSTILQLSPKPNVAIKDVPYGSIAAQSSSAPLINMVCSQQESLTEPNATSEDSNDSCQNNLLIESDHSENGDKNVYNEESEDDGLKFVETEMKEDIKSPVCISIPEKKLNQTILWSIHDVINPNNNQEPKHKVTDYSIKHILNVPSPSDFNSNTPQVDDVANVQESVECINNAIPDISVSGTDKINIDVIADNTEKPFKTKGAMKSFASSKFSSSATRPSTRSRSRSMNLNTEVDKNLDTIVHSASTDDLHSQNQILPAIIENCNTNPEVNYVCSVMIDDLHEQTLEDSNKILEAPTETLSENDIAPKLTREPEIPKSYENVDDLTPLINKDLPLLKKPKKLALVDSIPPKPMTKSPIKEKGMALEDTIKTLKERFKKDNNQTEQELILNKITEEINARNIFHKNKEKDDLTHDSQLTRTRRSISTDYNEKEELAKNDDVVKKKSKSKSHQDQDLTKLSINHKMKDEEIKCIENGKIDNIPLIKEKKTDANEKSYKVEAKIKNCAEERRKSGRNRSRDRDNNRNKITDSDRKDILKSPLRESKRHKSVEQEIERQHVEQQKDGIIKSPRRSKYTEKQVQTQIKSSRRLKPIEIEVEACESVEKESKKQKSVEKEILELSESEQQCSIIEKVKSPRRQKSAEKDGLGLRQTEKLGENIKSSRRQKSAEKDMLGVCQTEKLLENTGFPRRQKSMENNLLELQQSEQQKSVEKVSENIESLKVHKSIEKDTLGIGQVEKLTEHIKSPRRQKSGQLSVKECRPRKSVDKEMEIQQKSVHKDLVDHTKRQKSPRRQKSIEREVNYPDSKKEAEIVPKLQKSIEREVRRPESKTEVEVVPKLQKSIELEVHRPESKTEEEVVPKLQKSNEGEVRRPESKTEVEVVPKLQKSIEGEVHRPASKTEVEVVPKLQKFIEEEVRRPESKTEVEVVPKQQKSIEEEVRRPESKSEVEIVPKLPKSIEREGLRSKSKAEVEIAPKLQKSIKKTAHRSESNKAEVKLIPKRQKTSETEVYCPESKTEVEVILKRQKNSETEVHRPESKTEVEIAPKLQKSIDSEVHRSESKTEAEIVSKRPKSIEREVHRPELKKEADIVPRRQRPAEKYRQVKEQKVTESIRQKMIEYEADGPRMKSSLRESKRQNEILKNDDKRRPSCDTKSVEIITLSLDKELDNNIHKFVEMMEKEREKEKKSGESKKSTKTDRRKEDDRRKSKQTIEKVERKRSKTPEKKKSDRHSKSPEKDKKRGVNNSEKVRRDVDYHGKDKDRRRSKSPGRYEHSKSPPKSERRRSKSSDRQKRKKSRSKSKDRTHKNVDPKLKDDMKKSLSRILNNKDKKTKECDNKSKKTNQEVTIKVEEQTVKEKDRKINIESDILSLNNVITSENEDIPQQNSNQKLNTISTKKINTPTTAILHEEQPNKPNTNIVAKITELPKEIVVEVTIENVETDSKIINNDESKIDKKVENLGLKRSAIEEDPITNKRRKDDSELPVSSSQILTNEEEVPITNHNNNVEDLLEQLQGSDIEIPTEDNFIKKEEEQYNPEANRFVEQQIEVSTETFPTNAIAEFGGSEEIVTTGFREVEAPNKILMDEHLPPSDTFFVSNGIKDFTVPVSDLSLIPTTSNAKPLPTTVALHCGMITHSVNIINTSSTAVADTATVIQAAKTCLYTFSDTEPHHSNLDNLSDLSRINVEDLTAATIEHFSEDIGGVANTAEVGTEAIQESSWGGPMVGGTEFLNDSPDDFPLTEVRFHTNIEEYFEPDKPLNDTNDSDAKVKKVVSDFDRINPNENQPKEICDNGITNSTVPLDDWEFLNLGSSEPQPYSDILPQDKTQKVVVEQIEQCQPLPSTNLFKFAQTQIGKDTSVKKKSQPDVLVKFMERKHSRTPVISPKKKFMGAHMNKINSNNTQKISITNNKATGEKNPTKSRFDKDGNDRVMENFDIMVNTNNELAKNLENILSHTNQNEQRDNMPTFSTNHHNDEVKKKSSSSSYKSSSDKDISNDLVLGKFNYSAAISTAQPRCYSERSTHSEYSRKRMNDKPDTQTGQKRRRNSEELDDLFNKLVAQGTINKNMQPKTNDTTSGYTSTGTTSDASSSKKTEEITPKSKEQNTTSLCSRNSKSPVNRLYHDDQSHSSSKQHNFFNLPKTISQNRSVVPSHHKLISSEQPIKPKETRKSEDNSSDWWDEISNSLNEQPPPPLWEGKTPYKKKSNNDDRRFHINK